MIGLLVTRTTYKGGQRETYTETEEEVVIYDDPIKAKAAAYDLERQRNVKVRLVKVRKAE